MIKNIVDLRRDEIINACEKLYKDMSFKDITIKHIGEETSFSRTSIYNYFQTKEEIFLALFKREYERWIEELDNMYTSNENLTKELFASKLAQTIDRRPNLLKLLAMNLYDMEDNSRIESLIDFKKAYGESVKTVNKLLDKFFIDMPKEEKDEFIFSFFPFMYGIYPYAYSTDKQKEAMKQANIDYKKVSIYEIAYKGILKLL